MLVKFLVYGFVLFFCVLLLGIVGFFNFSQFGKTPSVEQKKEFIVSKQFNSKNKKFENRQQRSIDNIKPKDGFFKILLEWFRGDARRHPSKPLPFVKPSLKSSLKEDSTLKSIWLGHSTFLLRLSNKTILVDPVLTLTASPFNFMVKRFQNSPLSLQELPKIDYIVISHDHYDHLDMESIKYFINSDVIFITPLGVGSHLVRWGIKGKNIKELDWWDSISFESIEFTATPAQHFSGRDGVHNNETLWASWVITNQEERVFFSGDSGYDSHFKEIGEKLGPFDLVFMENGQYNINWKAVHLFPTEAVQATIDLRGKSMIPIHWGMFELAFHAWDEPINRIFDESKLRGVNILTPKLGEIFTINSQQLNDKWWVGVDIR